MLVRCHELKSVVKLNFHTWNPTKDKWWWWWWQTEKKPSSLYLWSLKYNHYYHLPPREFHFQPIWPWSYMELWRSLYRKNWEDLFISRSKIHPTNFYCHFSKSSPTFHILCCDLPCSLPPNMNYTNERTEEESPYIRGEKASQIEKMACADTRWYKDTFGELHSDHLELWYDYNLEWKKEVLGDESAEGGRVRSFTKDCRWR